MIAALSIKLVAKKKEFPVDYYAFFEIFKILQPSVAFHIETSHLICSKSNDWLYMKCNAGLKWVKVFLPISAKKSSKAIQNVIFT